MPLGQFLERVGVDDLHLHARNRSSEQRQPARTYGEVVGVVDLDRLGDTGTFEHFPVDGVAHEPGAAPRERRPDRRLGHAERREHAPRSEAERRCGRNECLDRFRVDRLGATERQCERSTDRVPSARSSARVASTHEKFGPAVAVPRQSEIHCIQLPGRAMKSCGAAWTSSTPLVIGNARNPTSPMSW